MDNLRDITDLKEALQYVDKIKDCIDKIDDLTNNIELKFPFKIDSLISIIEEKTYELDSYIEEELKYKEGEKYE